MNKSDDKKEIKMNRTQKKKATLHESGQALENAERISKIFTSDCIKKAKIRKERFGKAHFISKSNKY